MNAAVTNRNLHKACVACRTPFLASGRRGRPAQFCSRKCRDIVSVAARQVVVVCPDCGKRFKAISRSGKYRCADCRRNHGHGLRNHTCQRCGAAWRGRRKNGLYCPGCRATAQSRPIAFCIVCGDNFKQYFPGWRCCSRACSRKNDQKSRNLYHRELNRHHREVKKAGERFSPFEIFDRDGWTCQICGKAVDRNAKAPNPKSATIDHIIPVSKGGEHSRRNVQCAHLSCNSRRGNRGVAQQRLFAEV